MNKGEKIKIYSKHSQFINKKKMMKITAAVAIVGTAQAWNNSGYGYNTSLDRHRPSHGLNRSYGGRGRDSYGSSS